jgi:hypothetical protein
VIPGTIVSLNDLDAAMPTGSTLYPRSFLFEQPFGHALASESVLTHVGYCRVRVALEDLVNHFDCIAVPKRPKRTRDPH